MKYFDRSPYNLIQLYEDDKPYEGHHMFNSVDIGNMSFDEYLEYISRNQNDRYIKWREGKIINYSKIVGNADYEKSKVNFITTMKKEYGIVTFQILYKTI